MSKKLPKNNKNPDILTKKEQGFVKDLAKGKSGTQAAKDNFNMKNKKSAQAYASKLKKKPKVIKRLLSIADSIPDELLVKKHKNLLEQKQLSYFVFSKNLDDSEIESHMKANGLDLIVIRETEKGKMAFYSIDDAQAIKSGLDMAYKLKSSYAPIKIDAVKIDDKKYDEFNKALEYLHGRKNRTSSDK